MVALSAKRLVWLAMSLISLTTSPMRLAVSASPRTIPSERWAVLTASREMALDRSTCDAISPIEADSSSVAAATESTFMVACSAAAATVAERSVAVPAVLLMVSAVPLSVWAEWATSPTTPLTEVSNSAASRLIRALRSASARRPASCCSLSSRRMARALSLNTWMAWAMAPISAPWSRAGTSTSSLPATRSCMAAVNWRTGTATVRAPSHDSPATSTRMIAAWVRCSVVWLCTWA